MFIQSQSVGAEAADGASFVGRLLDGNVIVGAVGHATAFLPRPTETAGEPAVPNIEGEEH
jgi:hypothetical protein